MSRENLLKFSRLVLENLELQSQLKPIEERDEFIDKVLELGKKTDFDFSREDIEEQIREHQREWIERWI